MAENETIGVYFVDATDLEGWTNETLAEALTAPLAEIGLDVEIGQSVNNPAIYAELLASDLDAVFETCQYIVDRTVSN